MKRNAQIEFFRCLLMLGICLLHAVGNSGYNDYWLSSMLSFCVDGFVLISGYFGIKFAWKKVAVLEATSVWCAFLASCALITYKCNPGGGGVLAITWKTFLDYWFLHAYVVLMLVAPILNKFDEALAGASVKTTFECLFPFFVLCFGWSWATSYNTTLGVVPRAAGLGHFTPLTLIGVYLAGRIVRRYESDIKLNLFCGACLMAVLLFLSAMRLGPYNSPIALGLAIGFFLVCKNIHLPESVSKPVGFISPSLFAVYLLHVNTLGMAVIIPNLSSKIAFYSNKWIAYLLCALTLFCMGIIVDLIRRVVVHGLNWSCNRIFHLIAKKEYVRQ